MSTAADQPQLVRQAMGLPVFASIVAMQSATLPVVGTVTNTATLLGLPGADQIAAGLGAALAVIDRIAGRSTQ